MKKVCVITATRAEYGQLKPVIERLLCEKEIEVQLLVTGTHLMEEYGYTYKEIEDDGFDITRKVYVSLKSNQALEICNAMGEVLSKVASELSSLAPDVVVILGDRYEMLAIASAATVLKIPIAHISGGDVTLGALDDYFRNAITKMSYLHFAFTEANRHRIIQMGENPSNVYNIGALGIENIKKLHLLSPDAIYEKIKVYPDKETALITYHPVTNAEENRKENIEELFRALDLQPKLKLIFTKANSDCGGDKINKQIEDYVKQNVNRVFYFASLGTLNYLSIMKSVGVVIGNSSSGVVEAPSLKVPTINIGDRQLGRQQADSIINCRMSEIEIEEAIERAYSTEFQKNLMKTRNPFEGENPSANIVKELINFLNRKHHIEKKFYEIGGEFDF